MIIDYSTARPSIAALKGAGVTAVGRYLGWDSVSGYASIGKNLSKAEAMALLTSGISVFLVFEYNADAAALGSGQGVKDGQLALQQLRDLGAPPDMTVYFAVDFDIPDYAPGYPATKANAMRKLGPVGAYFQAIKNLKAPYEIGIYGGYWAVSRALDARLVTKSWQTVAWSGGNQDSRCNLLQLTSTPPIQGADIDIRVNSATSPDFGQWPRPGTPAPVATLTTQQMETIMQALPIIESGMTDAQLPYEYISRLQAILKDVYGYPVTVSGSFDAATTAAVKQLQARYGLTQDGIVGPQTWTPVITGAV
jgi:Rv2525c-like, glycoside hydrolase-like domain/Putative peptidoglycan binding domain